MTVPLTVLMAVHNGERFVRTAVDSILHQTDPDFRFLIVEDASTDATYAILSRISDPRLEILRLDQNVGQTAALNIGLRYARTPYIARMDADDFSAPRRLEEQMRVLRRDPSLDCVGTFAWEFLDEPSQRCAVITRPESYPGIRRAALYGAGLIHGTIVVRREALLAIGGYDERYRYASDRDLFIRFLPDHKAVNIPQPLLGIRRHPGQDSFSKIALDEYVDIFARLLADESRHPEETALLKGGLAYSYLRRAEYFRRQGRMRDWAADGLRALRLSPGTCARHLLRPVVKRFLPKPRPS